MTFAMSKKNILLFIFAGILFIAVLVTLLFTSHSPKLSITKGAHIIMVGNNLGSRMMNFGYF